MLQLPADVKIGPEINYNYIDVRDVPKLTCIFSKIKTLLVRGY